MNDTTSGQALSLREFWLELRRGGTEEACPSSALRASARSYPSSGVSSGSAGGGSGLLGYGVTLIAPDAGSRERVMRIMKDLCEKDARR